MLLPPSPPPPVSSPYSPLRLAPGLSVSRSVLPSSGDTVTVTWTGIPNPMLLDWMGLWSADNSTLFAWFNVYEQPTFHRKQAKWPTAFRGGRGLRGEPLGDVPPALEEILDFTSDIAHGNGCAPSSSLHGCPFCVQFACCYRCWCMCVYLWLWRSAFVVCVSM